MRFPPAVLAGLLGSSILLAQASLAPPPSGVAQAPPSLAAVRQAMGIPSRGDLRGQQDALGFATTPGQMARIWATSSLDPVPEGFGPLPAPGVVGMICPHDDYLYAGRIYRRILPLVTARTVVIVGVFHKYRRFAARDQLVFDDYRAWRAPDGEIPVSSLRADLLARIPEGDRVQDPAMQDSEHSVEAIAYWLKHQQPDVEIVPILVPAASFERLQGLAAHLGKALADSMKHRRWTFGKDLAVIISTDGIHYGGDFNYTPYGAGGLGACQQALDQDRGLLRGPLSGPVSSDKAKAFFETVVNPSNPDEYRMPWCGRFSVPFGLLLLAESARNLGLPTPAGMPVAFGSSVGFPQLPIHEPGLGVTAEANLYHFVSYPGVAFVVPRN